ncbi:MAG: hypothetical protein H6714_08565 [Myxococcales bacterium]|nr:hypothetical protein [Myxococcales bacterium]
MLKLHHACASAGIVAILGSGCTSLQSAAVVEDAKGGISVEPALQVGNWPPYLQIRAVVPVMDTLCDKTVQVYATLKHLQCEDRNLPGIKDWTVSLTPGYSEEAVPLVLDPLHMDDHIECQISRVSPPWYTPDANATAGTYTLAAQGVTGLGTLRFSAFKSDKELTLSYLKDNTGRIEVDVRGLFAPPQTEAFKDHITTRRLDARLRIAEGLKTTWVALHLEPTKAAEPTPSPILADPITRFSAEVLRGGTPLGVEITASYETNAVQATEDRDGERTPLYSVNVIRYIARPFDNAKVSCNE